MVVKIRTIGAEGDDGDSSTDQCTGVDWDEWCDDDYFSPTGTELDLVLGYCVPDFLPGSLINYLLEIARGAI